MDAACQAQYLGTVELDAPRIEIGLPVAQTVLIEFVFKPSGSSTQGNLVTTALIGAVMVPAMYLTDRFAYRMAVKRGAPVEDPPTGRFGRSA